MACFILLVIAPLPVYSYEPATLAADLSTVPKHSVLEFTAASRGLPATARLSCFQ